MRVCIWTNMPNHNQVAFFSALREEGVDLCVRYYGRVSAARTRMGWPEFSELPEGECYLAEGEDPLVSVPDFHQRIHVIPGYRAALCRRVAMYCVRGGVPWVHWSEAARRGWRWIVSWPMKRWWAGLINRYALGALGTGNLAVDDLLAWGIHREKVALLPYCVAQGNRECEPDPICSEFAGKRLTFIYLGALCSRKATDVLLHAFGKVKESGAEARLLLVGPDTTSGKMQRLAVSLGLKEEVLFRGPIPAGQCQNAIRCGHVLILPSRHDGWGMVLSEAAALGLAIIGSDASGGSEHLIETGENGFIVRAGSVDSLTAAMGAYCRNQGLARVHGARSLAFFEGVSSRRNATRLTHAIESWLAMAGR